MVYAGHMGIETVSLIIAALVHASLGVASLMRNYKSRLCISFAALALCLFAHDATSILEAFETTYKASTHQLHFLTTLLIAPAALQCLRFMVPPFRKSIERGFWLMTLGFFSLGLLGFVPWFSERLDLMSVSAHASLSIPASMWVWALARGAEKSSLTREKNRYRYALWTGVLAIALHLTNALHFSGNSFPPLGTLARSIYFYFIFQLFVQKEIMTFEEVVAKSTLFGGVALMLSAVYWLLVSWVGNQPGLFIFNTFIASFAILVLFDPIRNITFKLTRRLLLHQNTLLEDELKRLSHDLMGLVDPVAIATRMESAFKRAFAAESGELFLLGRDELAFLRVPTTHEVEPKEVSSSHPLIEYMLLRRGRPFVMETLESDRDSFFSSQPRAFCEQCLEQLRSLKADLVIPLLGENKVAGFCAIRTGERTILTNEQLKLLHSIAEKMAVMLKNVQTFTLLRDRERLAVVGEMAAGLAHEIKNPLGAIRGAAELILEQLRRNPIRLNEEFLKIIMDETDRLSRVLTQFLDYAKPRRQHLQGTCNARKVVEHAAELVLRDKKIRVEIDGNLESWVDADPEILKQVLLNLLLNSVQAVDGVSDRKPSIRVTLRKLGSRKWSPLAVGLPLVRIWETWVQSPISDRASHLEISVDDNGIGIQGDDPSKLFQPFYTTKQDGTGLGLAICQRLIEAMGGSIHAQPLLPHGASFSIHLPIHGKPVEKTFAPMGTQVEGALT